MFVFFLGGVPGFKPNSFVWDKMDDYSVTNHLYQVSCSSQRSRIPSLCCFDSTLLLVEKELLTPIPPGNCSADLDNLFVSPRGRIHKQPGTSKKSPPRQPNTQMGVSINGGTPKSSILIGFSHYKPSIVGYPHLWKPPNNNNIAHVLSQHFGSSI